MKYVFVINGSGGVGKDTFCNFVAELVPTRIVSSVDPIKTIAKEVGWNGAKEEKDRKFLSDLKDLLTEYNDYPMEYMKEQCKQFAMSNDKVLFLHIREPKEIERAVNEFCARAILVTNINVQSITSNHADSEVNNYEYDIHVHNDGSLEELKATAKRFCETMVR